jgi:hypothetical protein
MLLQSVTSLPSIHKTRKQLTFHGTPVVVGLHQFVHQKRPAATKAAENCADTRANTPSAAEAGRMGELWLQGPLASHSEFAAAEACVASELCKATFSHPTVRSLEPRGVARSVCGIRVL